MSKKVLIVVGTHDREDEFSHSVADRLIEEYGKKEPEHTFVGVDSACQGRLWLYEDIAVAKIDRIGKTSAEYLRTLSCDDIVHLVRFKLEHEGCKFPPSIDGIFDGINQWTSVSQQLVDASEANVYLDLHSFHAYSQLDGTGLFIISHAGAESADQMKKSVDAAKKKEPEVYGTSEYDLVKVEEEISLELYDDKAKELAEKLSAKQERLINDALRRMDKTSSIDLLCDNPPHHLKNLISVLCNVNSQLLAYEDRILLEMGNRLGNTWSFVHRSPNGYLDSFTFEAVHWKNRQQEAFVNFIMRYLKD